MPTLKRMQLLRSGPSPRLALQAALVVAPILLSAGPSHAAISIPFNGFTGAFAPANWNPNNSGSGSSFVDSTTLSVSVGGLTEGVGQRNIDLDAVLNQIKPPNAISFINGKYKFDWSWTFTDVGSGMAMPFGQITGLGALKNLAIYSGPPNNPFTPSSYLTGGTVNGFVKAGDPFGFGILNTSPGTWATGVGTGTITNFSFVANYSEVPGPLPLAGAAAGFAWSRRLRRRLKEAQLPS